MTFPAIIPSRRAYNPGRYSVTPHPSMSGSEVRVKHSNMILDIGLELAFNADVSANIIAVRDHYRDRKGGFLPFPIPPELLAGKDDDPEVFTPPGYLWRYASRPRVVDIPLPGPVPANRHDLIVELVSVPPEQTIVAGLLVDIDVEFVGGFAMPPTYFDVDVEFVGGEFIG